MKPKLGLALIAVPTAIFLAHDAGLIEVPVAQDEPSAIAEPLDANVGASEASSTSDVAPDAAGRDTAPADEAADELAAPTSPPPTVPADPVAIPTQAETNDEISIDPEIVIAADDNVDAISTGGAVACATVEVAIEAARTRDWPLFEATVYEAVPLASAAPEVAIARFATPLLDLALVADPSEELNQMMNTCVSEGYQL